MATGILDTRQRYERDGYVIYRSVLDTGLIAEAGDQVAWLHKIYPDQRGEHLSPGLVARDPFWVRLVSDGRLLTSPRRSSGRTSRCPPRTTSRNRRTPASRFSDIRTVPTGPLSRCGW
jgi:hypothetical protein